MRKNIIFTAAILILLGFGFALSVFSITASRIDINKIEASRPIIYEKTAAKGEGKTAAQDLSLAGLLPFLNPAQKSLK